MRIMVVNNTVMFERGDALLVDRETGRFFVDLRQGGQNEIYVFQFRMPYGENDAFSNFDLNKNGLIIKSIRRRRSKKLAYVRALIEGFKLVRKVDFVYLFYPGHICSILAFFCLLHGKRFGFYLRGENGSFDSIPTYLYRRATVIFTVSPGFTERIVKLGGKAFTVRPMMQANELDINRGRSFENRDSFRLLYVGRIVEDKGLFDLIDALEILHSIQSRNFSMSFVGDGIDLPRMQATVEKSPLHGKVFFHGNVTDKERMAEFFRDSDLFVLPTHHEGFPRVIYEAMIFSTPIVTTFVGTIPYLMKDRFNCFKIESKDPYSIATVLGEIFGDYSICADISKNATQTIEKYLEDKPFPHHKQLLTQISTNEG